MCHAFPVLTIKKFKADIFNSTYIRQLIRDRQFEYSEKKAEVEGFILMGKNFLGNKKATNNVELFTPMLTALRNLGCSMSIKMHYLFTHIYLCFPENLGSVSDEQGKRFHQKV